MPNKFNTVTMHYRIAGNFGGGNFGKQQGKLHAFGEMNFGKFKPSPYLFSNAMSNWQVKLWRIRSKP